MWKSDASSVYFLLNCGALGIFEQLSEPRGKRRETLTFVAPDPCASMPFG